MPYISVIRFLKAEDIGSDNIHPTDHGHHDLARRIDRALTAAGVKLTHCAASCEDTAN